MAISLLTGGSNASVKYFDIRVEDDHLILQGSPEEAAPVCLRGTLVLCIVQPLRVNKITLRFRGKEQIIAFYEAAAGTRHLKSVSEFFRHDWKFSAPEAKSSNVIPPGNYEWPFELELDGKMCESIEGLSASHVIYQLKATVERGLLAKDLVANHHIRLIRAYDQSSMDFLHPSSVARVWPSKVDYNISCPNLGVIYGSKIPVSYDFVPLAKGLQIVKIETTLAEYITLDYRVKYEPHRSFELDIRVVEDVLEPSEDEPVVDIEGREGFSFTRELQMPRKLRHCLQSVNEKNFKVRHRVEFVVRIRNLDGHISQLKGHIPIQIYIASDLRLNQDNELVTSDDEVHMLASNRDDAAPPGYGAHRFDPLYSGMDMGDYFTTSGISTPNNEPMLSVEPMDDRSDSDASDDNAQRELSANTLHNRLSNLTNPISSRWSREHSTQESGAVTPARGILGSMTDLQRALRAPPSAALTNEEMGVPLSRSSTHASLDPSPLEDSNHRISSSSSLSSSVPSLSRTSLGSQLRINTRQAGFSLGPASPDEGSFAGMRPATSPLDRRPSITSAMDRRPSVSSPLAQPPSPTISAIMPPAPRTPTATSATPGVSSMGFMPRTAIGYMTPMANGQRMRYLVPVVPGSGSTELGPQSPEHIEFDRQELSRVPSYETALQSRTNSHSDLFSLPTYASLASTPATPASASRMPLRTTSQTTLPTRSTISSPPSSGGRPSLRHRASSAATSSSAAMETELVDLSDASSSAGVQRIRSRMS